MNIKSYKEEVDQYARDVLAGKIIAGEEIKDACWRYQYDLGRHDLELRCK